MTNLFANYDTDFRYITVEDVKDSLGVPYTTMSNDDISKLIYQAEDALDAYLKTLNYQVCCVSADCTGLDCVPTNIRRAALIMVREIYEYEQLPTTTGATLNPGDIIREKSCETEVEYYTGETVEVKSLNPCESIPCEVASLVECFRVNSLKMPLRNICNSCCSTCR